MHTGGEDQVSLEKYEPNEVEPVLEGELVEPQPEDKPRPVQRVVEARVVRVVRHHEPTRKAAKGTLRHTGTVLAGLQSWGTRAWDASTLGVYRRQIRAAEMMGDQETLVAWVDRKEQAIKRRHKRLMDLPKLAAGLARAAVGLLAGVVGVVLVIGVFVQLSGKGQFTNVVVGAFEVAAWIVGAIAFAWTPLMVALPFLLVYAAWREGARRGGPARWAKSVHTIDVRQKEPTESAILDALRHLGVPELDKAFKDGWGSPDSAIRVWEQGAVRDGKGWHCQIILPKQAPVFKIVRKLETLAHNLVRMPAEVWPTQAKGKPGVLDMWVGDPGALSGKVDPWPLLHEGTADYFQGVPVGTNLRGDNITATLFESNYVAAGQMGSGKSTLVITLLLGAMLDPLVDIDVFVCADNADFEPLRPRLRTLIAKPGDETVAACMANMRQLYSELEVRGQALREHDNAPKVTRKLAEKDDRLRPRIMVVDECQAFFIHSEAAQLTKQLIDAARKYAITLVFSTPTPSADTLPRSIVTVSSNLACFSIGDQTGNDAVLGTGSYKAGISAVGLEPKTADSPGDVGTAMTRGFTPKPSLLRTYRVRKDDEVDQVTPVVDRALHGLQERGTPRPEGLSDQRDLLEDVAEVLGGEDVNAAHAAARLKDLPHSPWHMTGAKLLTILRDEHAIPIRKRDGYPTIRARDVADALAARQLDDAADE